MTSETQEDARRRRRFRTSIKESLRDLSIQLSLLNHQVGRQLALKDVDLDCLDLVTRHGPIGPSALARRAGLHPATITGILDRLERSGHLTRAANPDDRRSIFVQATPRADAEVRQTLGTMHDRMLAAVIDMTPEESASVVAFLRRMSDAVDGVAVETPAVDSP